MFLITGVLLVLALSALAAGPAATVLQWRAGWRLGNTITFRSDLSDPPPDFVIGTTQGEVPGPKTRPLSSSSISS